MNKDFVDERIEKGIEENRKGDVTIVFKKSDGSAVDNVKITAELKRHDFHFGANLFMLDELETEEKNEKYKEAFASLFNYATLPFYWRDLEPEKGKPRYAEDSPKIYRRPPIDLCLNWCKANNITPKEHCLNYDQWIPDWIDKNNTEEQKHYLEKRFASLSEHYADKIEDWEVTNETFYDKEPSSFYFDDNYVEWSFETAEKYFKNNKLVINEAMDATWILFRGNRTQYYMQIEKLLKEGRRIDKIGMQYHMFWPREDAMEYLNLAYDLKRFYKVLDKFSDFERPLQITEITIPAYSLSADDEQLQADIITRLYSLWFSHKNMDAITYWNLPDGYAAYAPQGTEEGENYYHGGLLRYDLSKKPAYYALDELINKKWHTKAEGNSKNGEFSFRGFYGEYELTCEANGKTVKKTVSFTKDTQGAITVEI